MRTLAEIETLTKEFSDARQALADIVGDLNLKIECIKRDALPRIKRAVNRTAERQATLAAAVDESRELFVKPRTVIFHGVKVGVEKGKGKIEIEDEDRTMKLIRKHLPDQVDALIKTDPHVSKAALKTLTVAELKAALPSCTIVFDRDSSLPNRRSK